MARYILGLKDNIGHRLYAAIEIFSGQLGLQPSPNRTLAMYQEVISQVLAVMNHHQETFVYDIFSLPNWATLLYTEDRHEFASAKEQFKNEIRSFAISLQASFVEKIPYTGIPSLYMLESHSKTLVVFTEYQDTH